MSKKKVAVYKTLGNKYALDQEIDNALSLLDLNSVKNSYKQLVEEMKEKKLSYSEFLFELLKTELIEREGKRLVRWQRKAGFPYNQTIQDYDFSLPTKIEEKEIMKILESDWIDRGENIIFLGQPGLGKTHLAIAFGWDAIQKGKEVVFMNLMTLIDIAKGTIRKAQRGNKDIWQTLFSDFSKVDLLILDEVSYHDVTPEVSDFLFRLVNERHQKKRSMILTSNEKFQKWDTLFIGNKARTSAVLDRLLERGNVFVIEGNSYRQRGRTTPQEKVSE